MSWLPLILLALLALVFPAYVLLRRPPTERAPEVAGDTNVVLYRERIAEIDAQLEAGDIDEQQAAQLKGEQQRLLLQDSPVNLPPAAVDSKPNSGRWVVVLMALLMPVIALGLYQRLGASADLEILALMEAKRAAEASGEQDATLTGQLMEKLEARLARQPEQGAYLITLARLHIESGNISEAVSWYRAAAQTLANQPEAQAEYAQAVYISEKGQFTPAVALAVNRALELDPGNVTALGLRGVMAFEKADYASAIADWQLALRRLPPQSSQAVILKSGIQRARLALGEELPGVTIKLSLADGLQANQDQTVYLFARQWQGPPMPLAVARLKVSDLPTTIKLDDSMAMPGGALLSAASAIEVVARVSSSGSVAPQSGDLQGISGQLVLTNGGLENTIALEIDSRLP